jgi:hypothetical protein
MPIPIGSSSNPMQGFGATIAAHLPELRAAAESLMSDTFRAYAPGATTVDVDGFKHPGYATQGDVPGKVQGGSQSGDDVDQHLFRIGDTERPILKGGLHIPIESPLPTAGPFGVGWEYECIAVGPQSDPILLGRRFLVVGVPFKSYATARRLDVVEL